MLKIKLHHLPLKSFCHRHPSLQLIKALVGENIIVGIRWTINLSKKVAPGLTHRLWILALGSYKLEQTLFLQWQIRCWHSLRLRKMFSQINLQVVFIWVENLKVVQWPLPLFWNTQDLLQWVASWQLVLGLRLIHNIGLAIKLSKVKFLCLDGKVWTTLQFIPPMTNMMSILITKEISMLQT